MSELFKTLSAVVDWDRAAAASDYFNQPGYLRESVADIAAQLEEKGLRLVEAAPASEPVSDQPPGIDEYADEYQSPDPVEAAQRIIEFVSWFGDGEIFGNSDVPLFSRDLEAVARAIGTSRVEWGVRKPTRHFGIKVDKSSDEASARRSVEMLHDTQRCLNANPKAKVVRRTVIETEWTPAPHPRNGS